ncbi:TPA: hypothetical protein DIV55_03870 [Patescibacteria group bacterium]|uniref:Uncharacterized protein n=1 Tax=Candidatus Gottesmanbacteria bacterium GW2011_GWA1_43_11 TaxID=1618436 RepID=A0A0G1CF52_9BACT|nr:MAG: hypothetical protein UV59_C0027G0027 [Candidatus Gottesmanbacteria bacterium GW2011_GWA1_43_11]HCS78857.1 hypothetical protein [Patescibacteria group bacterium]
MPKLIEGRNYEVGVNPDGSEIKIYCGELKTHKTTVLPPEPYMGKQWLQSKLPCPFPEGTRIYRGTQHMIIKNGVEVKTG